MRASRSKFDKTYPSRRNSVSANMRFWNRLTCGRVFGGTICVAILLFGLGIAWFSIFLFELVVVYVISEFLVGHLPSQIQDQLQRNCVRMDGSWSKQRERYEDKSVNKLRWDIRVTFLLVMIPTTLVVWLIDREVAPLSIGLSAASDISVSGEQWKSNLKDEEHEFDLWAKRSLGNYDASRHKRFLWEAWPCMAMIGVGWLAASGLVIQRMYIYQLKDLVKGIETRKWEYTLLDRSRSYEWGDKSMATDKKRSSPSQAVQR